ncbi:hypothetical protein J2X31_003507 [Flavobacterium arsenatis]|uniref:Lipocalin-like domain-containing protein n=1 Tax=Flavobacterium arsenatis TaxID=1484332 RepID=A0ABU1TUD5_9FLAO|nr:hypothetical protein [Flavobacterium arsenatis]MDR6969476.1 hypothetical protein [Flavobacterium arsenatis]
MKQLIFLFFIVFSSTIYSQENNIVGKWKVVEVKGEEFYIDVKKDTIIVSDKIKKWYPTKIGMQDEIASIRSEHYHKVFVFTDENEFFDYLSIASKSPMFTGKYLVEGKNKLRLDVMNRAKIKLKKEAEFYFQNNLLHLKMHTETNSAVEYVLEKIK